MANLLFDMKCVRVSAISVINPNKCRLQTQHIPCFLQSIPLLPSTGRAARFSSSICSSQRIHFVRSRKMTSTVSTNYTTVQIQPRCIAQKAADLPRESQPKSVVYKFPWRPLAEAIVQVVILTLAAIVSIQARLKVFVYLFCVLAVPQLLFIVTRFQQFKNGAFDGGESLHKRSSSDKPSQSTSLDVSEQPSFVGGVIRKTITEELGSFRTELTNFEKVSIGREESRNLSISQALSSVNDSVLALKEGMERRDEMSPSIPYATLQELESLKTRLSFFERENASIKQQLKASQVNYEEVLRRAGKARKEAEDASFRELSAREELAIAQSRTLHLDELTDRLDRAESKNVELQEELLTRAREREGFKLSADDANRRVTRMESVASMLREKLQKMSGSISPDAKDSTVDEDAKELQQQFWQKRLRNRGNLGRDSVVYQELLRGSKESLSKEWPSDPLGRGSPAKEEKNQAAEGLPADGGFASKNFRMLESAPNTAQDKKMLGMSGASSQSAFSFSRDEFEGGDQGTKTDKSSVQQGVDVNELFPEPEELSGEPASETPEDIGAQSQDRIKQADVSRTQDDGSGRSQRKMTAPEEKKVQILQQKSPQHRETSGSYMQWLENASRTAPSEPSPRKPSDSTFGSRVTVLTDSANSPFPSTSQSQLEMNLQKGNTGVDSKTDTPDNGGLGKPTASTASTGSTQDADEATKQSGDEVRLHNEEAVFARSKEDNRVKRPRAEAEESQSSLTSSVSPRESQDTLDASASGPSPGTRSVPSAKGSLFGNENSAGQSEERMAGKGTINTQESSELQSDVSIAPPQAQKLEDSGKVSDACGTPNSIAQIVSSKIAKSQTLIEKGRSDGISVSQAVAFLEQAKTILEECLRLNSLRPEVEAALGECLVAWAKLDLKDQRARWLTWKALEYLSRSVKAQPGNEKTLFNSALCNALFGALSTHELAVRHQYAAAQQFDKLLKLNPSAQVAAYNGGLAYLYLARSNIAYDGENKGVIHKYFVLAIERFAKGVMLNPHDPRNAAYLDTARNEMKNFLELKQGAT